MKKKLLFLVERFDTGGTEKVTFDILSNLDPEKYDITLTEIFGGGFFHDQLPNYIKVRHFFPRFMRYVIRIVRYFPGRWVYRLFIRGKYDVEVACGDGYPSKVIGCSPNRNSRKIAWIHMDVIARGFGGVEFRTERGRRKFYSRFDRIVNVSRECEEKFNRKFPYSLPTCVIYNPVNTALIRQLAEETPEYQLPKGVFRIICMGRMTPQKGFDRLIEAVAGLDIADLPPFHITILGDGYQIEELRTQVKAAGLDTLIDLPGHFPNPYPILKQADLFVLSSRDESFSLVVAEAMVLSIPVMSTRCTGPVELLRDGEAGCLVENSTEGIAEGLRKILQDKETYLDLQKKADENRENFRLSDTMAQIEALLDEEKTV